MLDSLQLFIIVDLEILLIQTGHHPVHKIGYSHGHQNEIHIHLEWLAVRGERWVTDILRCSAGFNFRNNVDFIRDRLTNNRSRETRNRGHVKQDEGAVVGEVVLSGHGRGEPWTSHVTSIGILCTRSMPAICQN